jgi:hypothetical protein
MVNSLRPTSAHGSIHCPIPIQPEQCIHLGSSPAPVLQLPGHGLPAIQSLPGVLDHFSARGNYLHRKDSEAVDSGTTHAKGKTCIAAINDGQSFAASSHNYCFTLIEKGRRFVVGSPCFSFRDGSPRSVSAYPATQHTLPEGWAKTPRRISIGSAVRFFGCSGVAWSLRSSSISSGASSLCSSLPCVFSSLEIAPLGADTLYANQSPLSIAADVTAHVPEFPSLPTGVIAIRAWAGC